MHSGTVSGKSFDMFTLNQGLLARCVEAVKEGDTLARKTGQIQSFEVFRNGFRMNLVIGRIMIIPPSVAESKEDFPTALLYGALVREIRPEDLADLMAAKIGDTEFDDYSEADMAEIKEKLFQIPGSKKYASLVLFAPSWTSPREYVMFKFTKDETVLANALRHLVFAAYFDPRLSSAFNHIMQDTDTVNHGTELDVTNITPKLNYPGISEGAAHNYPDLQSADDVAASQERPTGPDSKKKKKAGAPKRKVALSLKWADEIKADELERGEVDVISAVTEAAEAAILNKRENVSDVAEDDNAAKKATGLRRRRDYGEKRAGQVPCPYCKHSEPSTDDLEDHVARAHKNAKVAQLGHSIMPGCQGEGNHTSCPGVVEGVHCDCECHEKAEQEGLIGTTKSGADDKYEKELKAEERRGYPKGFKGPKDKKADYGNTPQDQEISALFKRKDQLKAEGKDQIKGGEYDAILKELQTKTRARLSSLKKIQAGEVNGLGEMKVKMKLNLDELPEKAQEKVVDGATGAAQNMGDAKTAGMACECSDPGCPMHKGQSACTAPAKAILHRVDMDDETGTAMCEECAVDAMDSGVFRLGMELEASSEKTADTADNSANEKGGEGAIEVKTDADIKNTRGTEPELAPDKNASAKTSEVKTFDTSTEAGIKSAERYKAHLENKYDKVVTTPVGLNRVRIEGKSASLDVYRDGKKVGTASTTEEAQAKFGRAAITRKAAISKVAFVEHCPGHKNSKGESAEWCVKSHETGKILSSHGTEAAAKSHLQDMHAHAGSLKLTAAYIRTAAITVYRGEDAQGPHVLIDMNGREYVLRGPDADSFRREYAAIQKPPAQVNALVEKYMNKLQPYNQKPAAAPVEKTPKNIHEPSAPGKPDINSWLKKQPAMASDDKTAGGHKPGCACGFCKNKGKLPGADKEDDKKDEKTASRGTFPAHMTNKLPNEWNDSIVIAVMHQLEVPRGHSASERDAESKHIATAREDRENKLAKLRRTVTADESDDLFAEVTEPMAKPPEVKVKDGDGRPDGATPKLADAGAMDWFITDRDEQGQPKENVPEELVIPESEPVTGVYNNDGEGKDPVGQALQSVTTEVKAPADLGESKATDVKEPLDLNEGDNKGSESSNDAELNDAAARWLGDESVEETATEETEPQHINASMTMKCPKCKGQAQKPQHGEPFKCNCGWSSTEPKVSTPKKASRKYASDRIIATLDDLLSAEPFDPVNEEHPDSSLLEGLVSGPLQGGRHETNDNAGPANKVADFDTATPTSDSQVLPKAAEAEPTQLGGPQNSTERPNIDAVREQVATAQEMDKHETIAEKEKEVAEEAAPAEAAPEEEAGTEVIDAPAGSGKIVINIHAQWLKAHGLEVEAAQEPQGIEVYDNGGKTIDRYTVIFKDFAEGQNEFAAVGMGDDVHSPQGFYQHTTAVPGEHLGQMISFSELPEEHQRRIAEELDNSHEAGHDDQAEPITSGQGGGGEMATAGPVGREGMPNLEAAVGNGDLATIASKKTAGPLADAQQNFFGYAKDQLSPHMPSLPSGGGGAAGEAGELGELAEVAPLIAADKTAERGMPRSTTPSKNYNGWHNWETWHVALLIDNEQPLYEAKRNLARRAVKDAKGGEVNVDKLADQMSKVLYDAYQKTKEFAESNAREMPDTAWATEAFEEVNWHEIAENAVQDERDNEQYDAANAAKTPPAPTASKDAATEKEAGFNFFFPGQVLREFYPEVQHEIVDYPNADNKPMIQDVDLAPGKMGSVQKEACECDNFDATPEVSAVNAVVNAVKPLEEKKEELKKEQGIKEGAADYNEMGEAITETAKEAGSPNYVSTDPGAIGIGRDGKPQVLEGAPLRKENDIRGPMFSEEFYSNYPGIPGSALKMQGSLAEFKKKAAASEGQKEMLADFLKKVMGEIACTFVAAFKVTSRPVDLDKIPGTGEVNLVSVENSVNNWPFYAGEVGGRVKFLLEQMNDSDIQDAINDAWSQAAVWHSGSGTGNFTYEVFVRAEAIDTDNMTLKYKFVTGTKGE